MLANTSVWKEIGRSLTTPTATTKRAEVKIDDYYLVVGFEVNMAMAFVDNTHDLGISYGHAFFYLVKNKMVTKSFSFGPSGSGKIGWFNAGAAGEGNKYNTGAKLKNGYINARPGTPDHAITEPVKAFRIKLTLVQAKNLEIQVDKIRMEIQNKKYKYNVIVNDTCAESAKEVLDDSGIDTPSGSGSIKDSKRFSFVITSAVNPYQWHHNFKQAGHKEVVFKPPSVMDPTNPGVWHPPIGVLDPIFGSSP